MEYSGHDRRRGDSETAAMIARIDERTKVIVETIPTLATRERVDAVEEKLDTHLETHVSRGGIIAAWAGVAVALVLGLLGLIKGGHV